VGWIMIHSGERWPSRNWIYWQDG
jgi:hypothetical protein